MEGTPASGRLRQHWRSLIGFVLLTLTVELIASYFSVSSVESWYRTLEKPSFNPPDWVFGPVWAVLYFLMAVAAWLVYTEAPIAAVRPAMTWFGIQLALNLGWSLIFFGAHQIGWALVDIVALWLAIGATIAAFARVNRTAAWLMAPYLAWASFATVLNLRIWQLNG